jgi:hypothetical protein
MDLEGEMYRFESSLSAEREKYSFMEPPLSDREKQAAVAIDAVSTCSLGVPLVPPPVSTNGYVGRSLYDVSVDMQDYEMRLRLHKKIGHCCWI